ncbi:MAG: acetyl/propionyl/methylcrotonyl-CoA carboxylase subunit alpha [Pseudomonadota bacterium]
MFRKILIANRGEIACRVARTARRLGVATVAVYSNADADAMHVTACDEAVHIGAAPVAQSYLVADRIIAAAKATGAEAIHPGYGFLSENPGFVEAVVGAGLRFIGPPADAIRAMGLKDAAKALMEKAGVPVVPGYHGADQAADHLAREAERIGYPVLIKARAGGGGKGMRLVERGDDFTGALESAKREAAASFGDDAVLIEKFVSAPRHIEVQVFADDHGDAVHLFERDCSLQRRHQKVIEEAPAPGMTEEMRTAMGKAAVDAAKAIGYSGAGTVEFIVDGSDGLRADRFYFMEMNTRLQVEHPVTELITGVDLVEWQLRIASGEPLPVTQSDLAITGWAFEARLYAEDPANDFLPVTGPLQRLKFASGAGIRIDTGVRQGDDITPFYDPMIAKIITHGPTRGAALNRLHDALSDTEVAGTTTNIQFLRRLARHDGFAKGEVDTGLIGRDIAKLTAVPPMTGTAIALAALQASGILPRRLEKQPASVEPWDGLQGWAMWGPTERTTKIAFGDHTIEARISETSDGAMTIAFEDDAVLFTRLEPCPENGDALWHSGGRTGRFRVTALPGDMLLVRAHGDDHIFHIPLTAHQSDADGASADAISAPMPGLVRSVSCSPGDTVSKDDPVVILEAMKMEHTLRAPRDGTVQSVLVGEGAQVSLGAALVILDSLAE